MVLTDADVVGLLAFFLSIAFGAGRTVCSLLDAEERAGSTEPYKWMASQLHVIAVTD